MMPLALTAQLPAVWRAALPAGSAGRWCAVKLRVASPQPWWGKVEVADLGRGHIVREAFFGPRRRGERHLLLHLPTGADAIVLRLFGAAEVAAPSLSLRVLTRPEAAWRLLWGGWRGMPRALAGDPRGMLGRVRSTLGQGAARRGEAPSYQDWIALYDVWGAAVRAHFARRDRGGITITICVLPRDGADGDLTLCSLARQWRAADRVVCPQPGEKVALGDDGWVLLLAQGDCLADHALACFADAAARDPAACGYYADCDELVDGTRRSPLFKPQADPWLLRQGLLTRGACLFRAQLLAPSVTVHDDLRETLALRVGADQFQRITAVLTHMAAAPLMAHTHPELLLPTPTQAAPLVTIIIPSACRSSHVVDCLRRLIAGTDYPRFEILLAVSLIDPADGAQRRILAAIERLPRVRIIDLAMPVFNYAAVNNKAAQLAEGDFLLLLNDDVVPCSSTWLRRMLAAANVEPGSDSCITEKRAAVLVGAKLIYGNGQIQHGGVIMGLANLCEHGFRLYDMDVAGPYGIARMNRQVSAVTGACLLIPRWFFQQLGGMDEAFAIALNDVDLCLRAGLAGARVLYAASVEMYHFESLSLGRHYDGTRASLEVREVQLLRQRWGDVIEADPFYNPQASLEPGREFTPAFPPRNTRLAMILRDNAE